MAIKPEETLKLSPEDIKEVDKCEKKIDQNLRERTTAGSKVEFAPTLKWAVSMELKRRYEAAGWTVEVKEDSRSRTTHPYSPGDYYDVTIFAFSPGKK